MSRRPRRPDDDGTVRGPTLPEGTQASLFTAAYPVVGIGLFVAFLTEVARVASTLRDGKDAA